MTTENTTNEEVPTINPADLDWSNPYTLAVTYYCFAQFVPEGETIEKNDLGAEYIDARSIPHKSASEEMLSGEGGAYIIYYPNNLVIIQQTAQFKENWQPTSLPGQWSSGELYKAIQVTKDFKMVAEDGCEYPWIAKKDTFILRGTDDEYSLLGTEGFNTKVDVLAAPRP